MMEQFKLKMFAKAGISCLFLASIICLCQFIRANKKEPCYCANPPADSLLEPCFNGNSDVDEKMVGVWISYLELKINSSQNTELKFKQKFDKIIQTAKKAHANTLIIHVRSHSDALYRSEFFPWSHLLTGVQGKDPGFDPLEYMVNQCHKNKLKIHAWINPLRIQAKNAPSPLSENNPCHKIKGRHCLVKTSDGLYYNPAYPEVRELIKNGVKEIVSKYDVDGIHFDDYFYPESKNIPSNENNYLSKSQAVNLMVSEVYSSIKNIKPNVQFGISPAGNINKCHEIGADPETWLGNSGYVDYLCPQLYWSLRCPALPFEKAANIWARVPNRSRVKLYAGLAVYKIGTNLDSNTWNGSDNILATEYAIIKNMGYKGIMLYSSSFLDTDKTRSEISNLVKAIDQ